MQNELAAPSSVVTSALGALETFLRRRDLAELNPELNVGVSVKIQLDPYTEKSKP